MNLIEKKLRKIKNKFRKEIQNNVGNPIFYFEEIKKRKFISFLNWKKQ